MDSIDIPQDYWISNRFGYVFTIVQKSIRFAKMKKLVVYQEMDYRGTYEVVEFHSFRVKDLSNMLSLMMFGDHCRYGVNELKKFKVKGRMSDNTEMYFVCLRFIEFNEKFIIKRKNHEQEREHAAALRANDGQSVPDAGPGDVDVAPF